jgi:putative FmdB family regulatory protein
MALYDFVCSDCGEQYEELTPYDETGAYPSVECPKCKSQKKTKLFPDNMTIGGPTSSKLDNFEYRAGFNMEKAKKQRREAEAASRVGASPYKDLDYNKDEGLHHPFPFKKD